MIRMSNTQTSVSEHGSTRAAARTWLRHRPALARTLDDIGDATVDIAPYLAPLVESPHDRQTLLMQCRARGLVEQVESAEARAVDRCGGPYECDCGFTTRHQREWAGHVPRCDEVAGRDRSWIRARYRVPADAQAVIEDALADRETTEGWCVDPECIRTAIVNDDGEPRCKCGAPLREDAR
jgi:hypothetical protein